MGLLLVHLDVVLVQQLLPLLLANGINHLGLHYGLRRLLYAFLHAYVLNVLAAHLYRVQWLLLPESCCCLDDLEEPLSVLCPLGYGIATVYFGRVEE